MGAFVRINMETIFWIPFPHPSLAVNGLPWLEPDSPQLRRLPTQAQATVPPRVWELAQFPGSGRIRFRSNTKALHIRFTATRPRPARIASGLDLYADGQYWNSLVTSDESQTEQTFFTGAEPKERELEIYLPLYQTITLHAIGVDANASVQPPRPFAQAAPLVLYGSSVAQGVGAGRPAMSYQAILCRRLNLDFINLGFGGAGKAEPEVVQYLNQLKACCFLLDLGKSYGQQDAGPYDSMLAAIREQHPSTPIVCITPIYSTHEQYDPQYRQLSRHTRSIVQQAVASRQDQGDPNLYLIEGLDLLGPDDGDTLLEGVHPSDLGYWRIARRLEGILQPRLKST
ncbi:MAG: hypothetical protein GKR89_09980 [Candidatus Latescibacteria bacterium]|nr:hypothetical protein [Candidatus Latescibacterota bacterium]